ncbi:MAG: ATP-binding protein [Acidobacteria bacterium]|nr:ATP-binding protein [Acidobacteriota bacterium]
METPHLDIDAHVVRQLGEELITDAEQALLELVKNSYDADSEWCNIIVDTKHVEKVPSKGHDTVIDHSKVSREESFELVGKIVVEDNGCGMAPSVIQRGWLTVSISPKRDMKARGNVTERFKRTPLGDKGLGRLGTMKLGNRLVVTTFYDAKKSGSKVTLFWNDCRSGKPLGSVPVNIETIPASGKTGTTIEICGLSDPDYWKGEAQLKRLEMKLSTLISPFKSFENFTVALETDGHAIDMVSFPPRFFETALGHFDFVWDDGRFNLQGRFKMDLLLGLDAEFFSHHLIPDNGDGFLTYLLKSPAASQFSIRKAKSKKWFVEFSDSLEWADVGARVLQRGPCADPGPFLGELHMFGFSRPIEDIQGMALNARDYAQQVKDLSGIYVYRDNFRIRLSDDWLHLGEAWTSGSSYYGLRPRNTLGFFAVSSRDNPELVEKSDREGFVDNAAKAGFLILAERVKDFANNSLEALRRNYNEYRREQRANDSRPAKVVGAKEGAQEIAQLMRVSAEVNAKIKESAMARTSSLNRARSELKEAMSSQALTKDIRGKFLSALEQIESLIDRVSVESDEIQTVLSQFAAKEEHIRVIQERFEQLEGQISEVYETVGLGLAAQALAHEIHPSIDEISSCIRGLNSRLKNIGIHDAKVIGDLEYVRAHAVMIGKKLAFIDPMLRTFRETKHDIVLSQFLKEFFDLRKDRLNGFGISAHVECEKGQDLHIRMNTGRLSQIIDNLARNSEYWLRKAALQGDKIPLEIHAELSLPHLIFWDSGPGVRPAMEDVCFDIFVTDKPRGEGHGLGLFIARQLLEEESCKIILADERNAKGRRFKFVVDFSGVLQE